MYYIKYIIYVYICTYKYPSQKFLQDPTPWPKHLPFHLVPLLRITLLFSQLWWSFSWTVTGSKWKPDVFQTHPKKHTYFVDEKKGCWDFWIGKHTKKNSKPRMIFVDASQIFFGGMLASTRQKKVGSSPFSTHGTGTFPYIYHKNQPNVGIYTIHG